jgi:HEPN domain-containing protein
MTVTRPEPWLDHALRDLSAARALLELGEEHLQTAAYLAAQAAEKLVKAALVESGIRPRKSHDIAQLVEGLAADSEIRARCERLGHLTVYAFAFRYPGSGLDETVPEIEVCAAGWRRSRASSKHFAPRSARRVPLDETVARP